jgi:hypothetical protein
MTKQAALGQSIQQRLRFIFSEIPSLERHAEGLPQRLEIESFIEQQVFQASSIVNSNIWTRPVRSRPVYSSWPLELLQRLPEVVQALLPTHLLLFVMSDGVDFHVCLSQGRLTQRSLNLASKPATRAPFAFTTLRYLR